VFQQVVYGAAMKVLFVQYGDFGEAYRRFRDGGAETYRDQKRSVDYVASLAPRHSVTVMAIGDTPSDETLATNLKAVTVRYSDVGWRGSAAILDREKPDVVIIRVPHLPFLLRLRLRGVRSLPCLADIFAATRMKSRLRNRALGLVLGSRVFPCVANHSLNASRSVAKELHYPTDRIVPWDWSRIEPIPTIKAHPRDAKAPTAFFAGAVTLEKGVQDCLEAIVHARAGGVNLSVTFAGPGDFDHWSAEAARLGVEGQVRFLGMVANHDVKNMMHDHDMVIVPSRHNYAEGLPNTIYEALASRTPLIVSDHPAFRGRMEVGSQCLEFAAANPEQLSAEIIKLVRSPDLYARLSANSVKALDELYFGIEWQDLIGNFLQDPENTTGWVGRHAIIAA
jgi:glycosyltransferase involved in cell wall biosynthesis